MMIGCAKNPALQFSSVTTPEAASGDGNEIYHADFLKMLDQADTSYDFIPGFEAGFDVEAYLTQNPDQVHFPNSIRFYEIPCIASREILMAKGKIHYRNRPGFIQYMQAWEAETDQRRRETGVFYGQSTATMITATKECLQTYTVEFDQDTGVLVRLGRLPSVYSPRTPAKL
ncbi:hypothetical protein JCM31598_17710 [Desulfonatronum parangueonense]